MSDAAMILGVLGGMGPAATLEFLARVQAYTPAKAERDHIRVIADIYPGASDAPAPGAFAGATLAEMAGALKGAGAEVLAMPSDAAHAHRDLIERASGLPLIDMIELAAEEARRAGALRVGVLGAKASIRLYREYLAAKAMGLVSLSPESQETFLAASARMRAGELSEELATQMQAHAAELARGGAEILIVGCPEAAMLLEDEPPELDMIDPGDLLARRAVAVCLGWEALPQAPA